MSAALLLLALLATASPQDRLEVVRGHLRAGRLAQAEALLAALPGDLDPLERATAQLLAGNAAFTRRDFALARSRYRQAREGFALRAPGPGEAGLEAVQSNLERCRTELERALRLGRWNRRLRLAVALAGSAGAAIVIWLAVRARRSPRSCPPGPCS